MAKLKRSTVLVKRTVSIYDVTQTLDSAIKFLTDLRDDTAGDAELDFEVQEDYGSHYIEGELRWQRPETDLEYERRCKDTARRSRAAKEAAETRRLNKEQEERAMLVKLKMKYEG
jgi:hypothetical protein